MEENQDKIMLLTIKDKDGKDIKLHIDMEQWQLNQDWYEWKEKTFRTPDNLITHEWTFVEWRKRTYGR